MSSSQIFVLSAARRAVVGNKSVHFIKNFRKSFQLFGENIINVNKVNMLSIATFNDSIFSRDFSGFSSINYKKFTEHHQSKMEHSDEVLMKGDKIMKVKLNSVRLDSVLKVGLQISRNKIEKKFYEDRIRVNGTRPKKKSQLTHEGDEIDIIVGYNNINPEFLDVSRIEIFKFDEEEPVDDQVSMVDEDSDSSDVRIPAVLKRYKKLTIENYREKWKGSADK